jgi:hypothetical protein
VVIAQWYQLILRSYMACLATIVFKVLQYNTHKHSSTLWLNLVI